MFGFIGIGLVRLKIFNSPTVNHTSLFEVVRWGLVFISLSLIATSSPSVLGSVVQFLAVMLLLEILKFLLGKLLGAWGRLIVRRLVLVSLRFKLFPPKRNSNEWW